MKIDAAVLVVEKQTALERYTRRALNVDFLEYIEQGGGSLDALKQAHQDHVACRTALLDYLQEKNVSHVIWNLDELSQREIPFFHSSADGIQTQIGLVLSLGGDGTLLHASHYVGGTATSLLGINSCPDHSVGALCGAGPVGSESDFRHALDKILGNSSAPRTVQRLSATLSEGPVLPLALNDILLCNQHPAATSRYEVRVQRKNQEPLVEGQHSSGLWVSTAAGSSAAISGYGLPLLPLEGKDALLAIREPYQRQGKYLLDGLQIPLQDQTIEVFCKMRAGLVCVDGPDHCALLGFGTTLRLQSPNWASLQLFSKAS